MDPERTYRMFIRHTGKCRRCRAAGGEMAKDKDLCPIGRALVRQWGKAETRYATAERARTAIADVRQ